MYSVMPSTETASTMRFGKQVWEFFFAGSKAITGASHLNVHCSWEACNATGKSVMPGSPGSALTSLQ